MNEAQMIEKAKKLRKELGGTIFGFPIEEDNPFSSYAIVMYQEGHYFPYPKANNLSEVSAGIFLLLELLKKTGRNANYERNVRLVSYQAQIDAPDVTMRRLKKNGGWANSSH